MAVEGPGGSGRTPPGLDLLREVEESGQLALYGQAAADPVPLGPFRTAVGTYLAVVVSEDRKPATPNSPWFGPRPARRRGS